MEVEVNLADQPWLDLGCNAELYSADIENNATSVIKQSPVIIS